MVILAMVVTRQRPQTQPPGLSPAGPGSGPPPRLQPPWEPCCDDCSHVGAGSCPRSRSPSPPPSTCRHTQTGQKSDAVSTVHPFPPPRAPGRGGGGGVATPQSRCRGAQPRCCGNGFQANWWLLAPGSGSLAHFPLLPSLRCGLGEGLPAVPVGSGWRYQARVLSHPQGGSSARKPSSARVLFPPGPQPSRYSRAQASSSNSSSCLGASGPADRTPSLDGQRPQGADSGNESRSERWAGGAGRAHGRVLSLACARAQPTEAPPPPATRRRGCCQGRGGWDSGPTCRTQTRHRGCELVIPRASQHRKSTLRTAPGNRLLKGAGGEGHTGSFAATDAGCLTKQLR